MNLLEVAHKLIDSFTGSESKFFPAFLSANADGESDKVYSMLGNYLVKNPTATSSHINSEFKGESFLAQLSVALTYLIERKILTFLAGPFAGTSTPEHEIAKIKILKERGIHDYAIKKTDTALLIAHRKNQHQNWLMLRSLKLKILKNSNQISKYAKWLEDSEKLRVKKTNQVVHLLQLEHLAEKSIPDLRKKFIKTAKFDEIIIDKIAQTLSVIQSPEGLDELNTYHWHQLSYRVALARFDEGGCFIHMKSIFEILQKHKDIADIDPFETISVYHSFSIFLFDKGQYKKGISILESMRFLFQKPTKQVESFLFLQISIGHLYCFTRSGKLKLLPDFWSQLSSDFAIHHRHQQEYFWIKLYLHAGLAAWLSGDNKTSLKWLNQFDGGLKSQNGPEKIAMIKTLLAFIHFQSGDQSMACSEAKSTLRFALTRKLDIGPFIHLLNFIKVNDPLLVIQGGALNKINQLETKFKQSAKNWNSAFFDSKQGLFFIDCLNNKK